MSKASGFATNSISRPKPIIRPSGAAIIHLRTGWRSLHRAGASGNPRRFNHRGPQEGSINGFKYWRAVRVRLTAALMPSRLSASVSVNMRCGHRCASQRLPPCSSKRSRPSRTPNVAAKHPDRALADLGHDRSAVLLELGSTIVPPNEPLAFQLLPLRFADDHCQGRSHRPTHGRRTSRQPAFRSWSVERALPTGGKKWT